MCEQVEPSGIGSIESEHGVAWQNAHPYRDNAKLVARTELQEVLLLSFFSRECALAVRGPGYLVSHQRSLLYPHGLQVCLYYAYL